MTYISLFSSAGIGCYGFKEQHFQCIATLEYLKKRLDIQRLNEKCTFNNAKNENAYIEGDITKHDVKQKVYDAIKNHNVKDVDVMIATPPCQGMSVANHHKNTTTHIKNSLVIESLELVKNIQPKFFIFENVKAFLKTLCTFNNVDICIEDAINSVLQDTYNIESRVINFKDYGAHSSRTRTLVIGARRDINVLPSRLFPQKSSEKTLHEVIGHLPSTALSQDIWHQARTIDKKYLPWLKHTAEGCSAFENKKPEHRPHKIVEGRYVANKKSNLDKYRRCS